MHDRLDHYDERALTERELQQLRWKEAERSTFKPWWGFCCDGSQTVKAGHRYQVIGEILHHIDGRRLAAEDERWLVAGVSNELTESGSGGEVLKRRIIPEGEYRDWQVANLRRKIDEFKAELDAIQVPDGRF